MPRLGQFITNNIGAVRQRQQAPNQRPNPGNAAPVRHGPMEDRNARNNPRQVQQQVVVRNNQRNNPRLGSPDVDPPTQAAQNYANSLEARQFHKEVFNKSVDDDLRRQNLGSKAKARMKQVNKHYVRNKLGLGHRIKAFFLLRWSDTVFPRASSSRYDNFFGSRSAGNQGLQESSQGLQVSHLQELKLHRNRRGLVRDLQNHSHKRNVSDRVRARTPQEKASEQTQARQMTRELQTVLNLQKRELQSIKRGRDLTPQETAFEAKLDSEITKLDSYQKQFNYPLSDGRTHTHLDTRKMCTDLNALFDAEPASLRGLSTNEAIARTAGKISTHSKTVNNGVSKGNVLQLASDNNLVGFTLDSKTGVTGRMALKEKQAQHWRKRERHFAKKLQAMPRQVPLDSATLTRKTRKLVLLEKQAAVSDVLKKVETNGLMPEFEARLQTYANQPKVAGLENETFTHTCKDGTTIELCVSDFKKVMSDWQQDHAAFRDNHKASHRGFWGRLGHRIIKVFDTSGHGAAATKGMMGGLETAASVLDHEVEALHELAGPEDDSPELEEHGDSHNSVQENVEKKLESLEHDLEKIEKSTGIIDQAEHGFAMIQAGRGMYKTKQEINHVKHRKALAESHKRHYEEQRDAAANRHDKLKFEYRNKVKLRHCEHISEESLKTEWAEFGVHTGKLVRHGIQATGKGMAMGKMAATGVKTIGQVGLALAVIVEAVETGVDIHTAHKARISAKQVKQGAKKFEKKILDKHAGYIRGSKPSIEGLQKGLAKLEKNFRENQEYLDNLPNDPDPLPDNVIQSMRDNNAIYSRAIADIKQDLQTLHDVKAIGKAMVDKKNVGTKIATATGSALATAGYGTALVGTIVAGGFLTIAAPVGAAIVGTTALALASYKTHKSGQRKWAASRSIDAIVGQADPKIVERLKKEARELGISPQLHAFNYLAKQDPRWLAAITHAQLKSETAKYRLTDEDIQNRAAMNDVQRGQMDEKQKRTLYEVSDVAKQLHDVYGMSMDAIASIVNADNSQELNQYGSSLIKEHMTKE